MLIFLLFAWCCLMLVLVGVVVVSWMVLMFGVGVRWCVIDVD